MTPPNPPIFPAWRLRTFGCGPAVDALLGDLSEEYQRGRSATWFWFQALTAIPLSLVGEVRAHPWLTIRATAVGAVLFAAVTFSIPNVRPYVDAMIDLSVPGHRPLLLEVRQVVDGQPVPDWRQVYAAPAYVWAQMTLLGIAGLLTGGWVSWLHRGHRGAAVTTVESRQPFVLVLRTSSFVPETNSPSTT